MGKDVYKRQMLLKLGPEALGISAMQLEMLQAFACGQSDQQLAKEKGVTLSTIRNYQMCIRDSRCAVPQPDLH